MPVIKKESNLKTELAVLDARMTKLNDKKIVLLIEAIGIATTEVPEDYLKWETILIVVPNLAVSRELRQYKFKIDRIVFVTNVYAKEVHLYNMEEWKKAIRNKTPLQIRHLQKTQFGGTKLIPED